MPRPCQSQLSADFWNVLSGLVSAYSAHQRDNPFNPLPKSVDRNVQQQYKVQLWHGPAPMLINAILRPNADRLYCHAQNDKASDHDDRWLFVLIAISLYIHAAEPYTLKSARF